MAAISKPKNLAEALEAKTKTMASAKKELAKVIDSEKEDDEENDDAYWLYFGSCESQLSCVSMPQLVCFLTRH